MPARSNLIANLRLLDHINSSATRSAPAQPPTHTIRGGGGGGGRPRPQTPPPPNPPPPPPPPSQWQLPGVASPPSTASSPTSVSTPQINRRRDIRAPTTQPPASCIPHPASYCAVHCHETTPAGEHLHVRKEKVWGPAQLSGPTLAHVRCRSVGHAWFISTAPAYAKPRDTLHVGRCKSDALGQV